MYMIIPYGTEKENQREVDRDYPVGGGDMGGTCWYTR